MVLVNNLSHYHSQAVPESEFDININHMWLSTKCKIVMWIVTATNPDYLS